MNALRKKDRSNRKSVDLKSISKSYGNVTSSNETKNLKRQSMIFQALANPNRLQLFLEILRNKERKVNATGKCYLSDIVRGISIGSPTISHHVRELSQAGLITTERDGKQLVCMLNMETIQEIGEVLGLEVKKRK
ncbi:ArsR/SmtB family transcription factor [Leptospira sp. GIMC2001]|uniref:ArsR/SmtB family transcription factor n=1 Tax=Leptospira sp. GIMC2001 TaxID=1513297 RepID=UPI0023499AA0|nr:metalloregulator ArsR/SmtB family transcription factor [Leptospira sp. GIMC2001]WCL48662.1 metalloregulator ArsR/SmtB family transcription factor [Leptospira sp. GIMC2001]